MIYVRMRRVESEHNDYFNYIIFFQFDKWVVAIACYAMVTKDRNA